MSKVYKLDPENQAKVSAGEGQSGSRAKVHPHIFNEEKSSIKLSYLVISHKK